MWPFRPRTLTKRLAELVAEHQPAGDLIDLTADAYLRQDMEWVIGSAQPGQDLEVEAVAVEPHRAGVVHL